MPINPYKQASVSLLTGITNNVTRHHQQHKKAPATTIGGTCNNDGSHQQRRFNASLQLRIIGEETGPPSCLSCASKQ